MIATATDLPWVGQYFIVLSSGAFTVLPMVYVRDSRVGVRWS